MLMEIKGFNKEIITGTMANARDSIMQVERRIEQSEGHYIGNTDRCPLKHTFADGIYVREIFIPAGDIIVGKIHKHEHPNFLVSGTVHVFTEDKLLEKIVAPCSMISPPGTKRTLYAETDLVWITMHHNPTNTRDIDELERNAAVDTYKEYDKFNSKKLAMTANISRNGLMFRFKQYLIKILEK